MKIGIILFILGLLLIIYLIKAKFTKEFIQNLGIIIGSLLLIYGIILMVQPSDDKYFEYTKTTISK